MDSSSSSGSWTPPPGRHSVNIGSSLGRVIKNRKLKGSQAAAPKRSNLPERDFYSFKFNFKASSIDTTRPATIEIKNRPENNQVLAEYPSTQPGEVHVFSGQEQPAKEVDCILIFDEETGTYTLEKVDSFVIFKSGGKQTVSPRSGSPPQVASSNSSSSSSKGKAKQQDYDIDRVLDETTRRDDDAGDRTPASIALRREEEEGEGEEPEVPLRQVAPPKPPPKADRPTKPLPKASRVEVKPPANTPPVPPKAKMQTPSSIPPSSSTAPQLSSSSPAVPPPAPQPKPAPTTKTKKPKATPAAVPSHPTPLPSHPSEEIMEFGRPTKRARPLAPQQQPAAPQPPPAPKEPVALSLPGGGPSFAPPPAPVSSKPSALSSSSSSLRAALAAPLPDPVTAPSPAAAPEGDSDDDEIWEEVVDNPAPSPPVLSQDNSRNSATAFDLSLEEQLEEDIFGDGFGDGGYDDADADIDGGVEIDPNAFAMELAEEMGESEGDLMEVIENEGDEDDFLAGAVSPVPGDSQQHRRPISLNQLASSVAGVGAPGVGESDDDYTSSEESDDD